MSARTKAPATEFTEKGRGATIGELYDEVSALYDTPRPLAEKKAVLLDAAEEHLAKFILELDHETRTNISLRPGAPLMRRDLDRIAKAEV